MGHKALRLTGPISAADFKAEVMEVWQSFHGVTLQLLLALDPMNQLHEYVYVYILLYKYVYICIYIYIRTLASHQAGSCS